MRRLAQVLLLGVIFLSTTAFVRSTFTHTVAVLSTGTAVVKDANTSRNYLLIQNIDASIVVYCKVGAVAVAVEGIRLIAGAQYEMIEVVPTAAVSCLSASGTPSLLVTEGAQP